jgi:Fe-S cluster biosynthesis and repair protein YggX
VGVEEETEGTDFKLYPNPAQDEIFIERNKPEGDLLQIIDLQGKLVLEHTLNRAKESFDVSHLKSGIYLVKTAHFSRKLILE